MVTLKRCPCGKVPDRLELMEGGTYKWALAYPDCCQEWMIEFHKGWYYLHEPEVMDLAIEAWNKAPRSEE